VLEVADLERLVETTLSTHGRVNAVVNNTGHAPHSSEVKGREHDAGAETHLLDISDEDWHLTLDLYFLNVVRMARLVTEPMRRGGGGAIVNISAFAASEPHTAIPTSSTIRTALLGFTKLYADRHGADNIRMNDVLPGFLDNYTWNDSLIRSIPLARAGALDEVAKTVAFLLSADAGYITGQSILADGGMNRGL
jgi:NAD(P)-dependent dehydrogenase (short-subunit alcohol dehydrogenase family)